MADSANLIRRYIGDDWTVAPIALTAGGAPLDLTGSGVFAEVFAGVDRRLVATLAEGAGVTVAGDRTTGLVTDLHVPRAVTRTIPWQDRLSEACTTRIDVSVIDGRGRSRVWLIIPVLALDRSRDVPPAP